MTILDGDITKGWLRDRVIIRELISSRSGPKMEKGEGRIPKIAIKYAQKMAETTGLPIDKVMNSLAFKKYLEKMLE